MKLSRQVILVLVSILSMPTILADEFRPALLEISETQPGWYSIKWKVPLQGGRLLWIGPIFPYSLQRIGPVSTRIFQGSIIEESVYRTQAG